MKRTKAELLKRKIQMFVAEHKAKLIMGSLFSFVVLLTIIGLANMESFQRSNALSQIPLQLLMAGINATIFVSMYSVFMRSGNMGSMKKEAINGSMVDVKFSDVIGVDEAKIEALEVVELLKDRTKVEAIGGKIVKGLILLGPPGTGKTLLAKAIASEAGVPFLSTGASEFVEMFVGVGAARIRSLFNQARELAYASGACILFIDEIDAIARGRQFSAFGGGGETNTTQNQLLIEMDGLGSKKEDIVVIAATNSPIENLDEALMRPGRFDRKIMVNRPHVEGRRQLFEFYLKKVKYDESINTSRLAFYTVGKSAADIENIVKEAALISSRDKRNIITHKDMTMALERIDLGIKIKRRVAHKEKYGTAIHEGGHALALYFFHPINDVFKLSIATRNQSLGVCHNQPLEELLGQDKEWFMANIKTALAGYIAEKVKFGQTTSGVSADFHSAMNMAHNMVWRLGMGTDVFLGDFMAKPTEHLDDATKAKLNRNVDDIIKQCYDDVYELLTREKLLLDKLSETLLEKEDLEYDEIDEICQTYAVKKERSIERSGVLQRYKDQMKMLEARKKEADAAEAAEATPAKEEPTTEQTDN